jgi:hypothetical protein
VNKEVKGLAFLAFAYFLALVMFGKKSKAQKKESPFTDLEKRYSFTSTVGIYDLDKYFSIGKKVYKLKAKENFGEEEKLWTEIKVKHSEELYDFRTAKYGSSSSQLDFFEIGKTYKLEEYKMPFDFKVKLVSKDGEKGKIRTSIIPEKGVTSCEEDIVLRSSYQSESYIMCRHIGLVDTRPVIVRFSPTSSFQGRLDYAGYKVYIKKEGNFERIGGFAANTPADPSISDSKISISLNLERVRKLRSGEYTDYGSKWIVDVEIPKRPQ